MRKLSWLLVLLALASVTVCEAQQINIIPQPVSLRQPRIAANFTISPATVIVLEGSNLETMAQLFNDYLQEVYHFHLKVVQNSTSTNAIRLNFERMDYPIQGAYA